MKTIETFHSPIREKGKSILCIDRRKNIPRAQSVREAKETTVSLREMDSEEKSCP